MALPRLTSELYLLYDSEKFEQCQKIMPLIKAELIKNNLLVPALPQSTSADQLNDWRIAQRILEIGALSALLSHDHMGFENHYAQLGPFYSNPTLHPALELNSETTKVISLYLLYLLSQGQIARFHTELEVLFYSSRYDIDSDKFLSFPISLERYLMEGNYIKVWHLLNQDSHLPCKEFSHFIATLVTALRHEIARSLEKTYLHIPVSNCKSLLYFPQEQLDAQFQTQLRDELQVDSWTVRDGVVTFVKCDEASNAPGLVVIENVLNYAEQLESIV